MRKYIALVLLLATGCKGINRAVDRLTNGGTSDGSTSTATVHVVPLNPTNPGPVRVVPINQ